MSFSLTVTGTAQQIKDKLAAEEAALGGQSQKELREVRGALDTLVGANTDRRMTLVANGHGTYENEQRKTGQVNVELRDARADEGHESDPVPVNEGDGGVEKTSSQMPALPTGRSKKV